MYQLLNTYFMELTTSPVWSFSEFNENVVDVI